MSEQKDEHRAVARSDHPSVSSHPDPRGDDRGVSGQCQQTIFVRDTYRYHGGKQRFKMHYTKRKCSRKASTLKGPDQLPVCTQHARCAW
jgi:hypothetical protein